MRCKSVVNQVWTRGGDVGPFHDDNSPPHPAPPPRGGTRQKGEATPRHGGLIVFGANTGHPDPIVEASSQVCSSLTLRMLLLLPHAATLPLLTFPFYLSLLPPRLDRSPSNQIYHFIPRVRPSPIFPNII